MFELDWGKMIVIGIVALIAIGPKELPGVLRTLGQWVGKVRRMAAEFQGQFQEAMREADIADLKKQFDDAANSVTSATSGMTNFDPLATTKKEIESAFESKSASPAADASPTPAASEAAAPATTQVPSQDAPAIVGLDLPAPEPAPLDQALLPQPAPEPVAQRSEQPPAAQPPAAQPPAVQPPKEGGA